MNRTEKLLKAQMKMGYWPGFTMAMYPNQFAYKKINVDFERIWKDRKEINLYYHIPFCKSICPYCGFFTVANNDKSFMAKYVDKLIQQLKVYSSYMDHAVVKSICYGGGTPNHIPIEEHDRIMNTLHGLNFAFDDKLEPSMEISPEIINEEYIKGLQDIGIRRLSLGVQSIDLNLRNTINRANNYNLIELVDIMRKHNMNLNIDVMSGIIGQTPKMFMDTLEKLMEFKPETISIYPLAGNGSSMIKKADNTMSNKEKYELFKVYYDYLLANGYYCESNVKFVLKNQPSTHQQKIYEYQGVDTMGVGCAARSYNYYTHYSVEKGFNPKERMTLLNEYMNNDFRDMQYFGIDIDEEERKSRFAIYGIFIGTVDMAKYHSIFNSRFEEDFSEQTEAILSLGLVEKTNEQLVLTKEGRVYTDLICTQFWSKKVSKLYNENR